MINTLLDFLPSIAAALALLALLISIKSNLHLASWFSSRGRIAVGQATFLAENEKTVPIAKLSNAFEDLYNYADSIKPNYIVGVNRGGTLTASLIALNLNIPRTHFFRCYSGSKGVSCDDNALNGTILILDDVCRSGKTLSKTYDYFNDKYSDKVSIKVATLVSVTNELGIPYASRIDFSSIISTFQHITLPWRSNGLSQESQFDAVKKNTIQELAETAREEIVSKIVLPKQ